MLWSSSRIPPDASPTAEPVARAPEPPTEASGSDRHLC